VKILDFVNDLLEIVKMHLLGGFQQNLAIRTVWCYASEFRTSISQFWGENLGFYEKVPGNCQNASPQPLG
jgi:hypothetical protein